MTINLTNIFTSARLLAASITSILLLGILAPTAFSEEPTVIRFDAPGAGTGPGQGTSPFSITPAGAIAGRYSDTNNVFHGFLRTADRAITTFDVLDAWTAPGQGTRA